jgi:hypothetical protein
MKAAVEHIVDALNQAGVATSSLGAWLSFSTDA